MAEQMRANITANMDGFDQIAKQINSGDLVGALAEVDEAGQQISMMDDPRDVAGIASRWKSTWNTWDEVWINGLLSSPSTFVVNTVGAAWAIMRPLLQGGFAKAFAASGIGGEQWTKAANSAAAEAGAQLAAMQASFQDAAILGWRAAKSEKSLLMGTDQKITAANWRGNKILGVDRLPPSEEIDRAIDMLGKIVRLPSRGMLGMDEFGKILALRGEVAANGVRRAVLDNVDPTDQGKALKRYVEAEMEMAFDVNAGEMAQRYAFDPSSVDDVSARANQYQLTNQASTGRDVAMRARESVFQEENRVAKGINKAINSTPFRGLLKPFIPFVTHATNILKQGLYESTGLDAVGKTFNIAKENGFNPTKTFNEIQTQLLNDPAEAARIVVKSRS